MKVPIKKISSKNSIKTINNQNDVVHIDYDELAKAMIKAQEEVKQHEEQEKKENHKKWQQKLGIKDPPTKLNDFWCGLKLFIFPKKYYSDNMNGTEMLMSTFMTTLFGIVEYGLYFISIMFLFVFGWAIYSKQMVIQIGLLLILLFIFCIFFGRIFRMAKIEVDNLKDNDKIISIFSAVVTFIAMVGTLLSISPIVKEFFENIFS